MENIGIVLADFHKKISAKMLESAKKACRKNKFNVVSVVRVTGAFDIPLPLKRMLSRTDIDAAIVLGAVVQGETSHDEVVAYTAAEKIVSLSVQFDKPVGYGISGPRMTKKQAEERSEEFASRAVEAVKRMLES